MSEIPFKGEIQYSYSTPAGNVVTNTQSSATPSPFQQMINFTSSDPGFSSIATGNFGQKIINSQIYDVILLQETKIEEINKLIETNGYVYYIMHSTVKKGYSGRNLYNWKTINFNKL